MIRIFHGRSFLLLFSAVLLLSLCVDGLGQRRRKRSRRVPPPIEEPFSEPDSESTEPPVLETRLKLHDGTFMPVDEAWESENGIWYKKGGITHLLSRDRVKAIERVQTSKPASPAQVGVVTETANAVQTPSTDGPAWIYLVGGARFEVESATESPTGVWYRRGPMSVFIERSRIARIEREDPETLAKSDSRGRGWSTGNARIDGLIKQNASRYGVDPYLIFCVMEQESHFNSRAVSPKGARGLMQLMPGTAARFGVRRVHDPAQNIAGGTRYLKQLLTRFNGRVDLVLASYNAGEGAVMKYGNRVPPYRETRNYVKRIGYKYRRAKKPVTASKPNEGGI